MRGVGNMSPRKAEEGQDSTGSQEQDWRRPPQDWSTGEVASMPGPHAKWRSHDREWCQIGGGDGGADPEKG